MRLNIKALNIIIVVLNVMLACVLFATDNNDVTITANDVANNEIVAGSFNEGIVVTRTFVGVTTECEYPTQVECVRFNANKDEPSVRVYASGDTSEMMYINALYVIDMNTFDYSMFDDWYEGYLHEMD